MSKTLSKPRKRLTREESRAQLRATLIAVGREHFIRYGLGGAVAEKIAEDAGYHEVRFTPISMVRRSCSLL